MYQMNQDFESRVALQTETMRATEATYDEFDLHESEDLAWHSPRLDCYDYNDRNGLESLPRNQDDARDMFRWNCVFGMNVGACMMQKHPICIAVPPADWSWCADPL